MFQVLLLSHGQPPGILIISQSSEPSGLLAGGSLQPPMPSLQDSLASWAAILEAGAIILGTVLSVVGLIQSRAWLTGISVLLFGASIVTGVYARRQRLIVKSAAVEVEGRSIDSLNIANLRRRMNRSLVIQEVDHVAIIEGADLKITWKYDGYCRADQETALDFSVDADNNIPYSGLECFAHDLLRDPGRNHKIRPVLIGTDGISKKIAVPFLEPLSAQQPFSVLLKCELPGCMKAGLDYYTSTLSFEQDHVRRCTVRLLFAGERPDWVRLYECGGSGRTKLLKDLPPVRENQGLTEYLDIADEMEAQSARIYVLSRPGAPLGSNH